MSDETETGETEELGLSDMVDRSARQDRMVEDRELTDDERIEAFRSNGMSSPLADIPEIPGYHLIWLSTTHPKDPIHRRIRDRGYKPVKPEELPGGSYETMTGGEFNGVICENEMILFKIPLHLHQAYMAIAHHERPAEQEVSIRDQVRQTAHAFSQQAGKDLRLQEGDGQAGLGQTPAPPTFT